jgi:hypothetical protein
VKVILAASLIGSFRKIRKHRSGLKISGSGSDRFY